MSALLRVRRLVLGSAVLSIICGGGLLMGIYPYRPNSALVWAVMFLVGAPIMLIGEAVGTLLLENRFVARMGKGTRMAYAVILGCALLIGLIALTRSNEFNQYFEPWGS